MALDEYKTSGFWQGKRLTPAQLLVHDVKFESRRVGRDPQLEIDEVLSSNLLAGQDLLHLDEKCMPSSVEAVTSNRREIGRLHKLKQDYGWMTALRVPDDDSRLCRWIHISSKFPEYLQGVLMGMSDWRTDPESRIYSLRQLDRCIYENERFSKHGKYFSAFFKSLASSNEVSSGDESLLMSVPFLDWTVDAAAKPPLRFQIDPREAYTSSRSQSHGLRSLLQHYYRLEDTSDRERDQVFNKHKPWTTDRELDLKIRRWYGHYPTGLNVDEIWLLVIDSRHIVTFSSNQTWKSRWPPLQLPYRASEVSFRSIRDNFFNAERKEEYFASTQAVACLHAAIGMIHRSFWSDVPLCLTDRYGGYLGHLQYRLHRAPNTKLVMDLLQVLEELNIVISITQKQEDIVLELQRYLEETWVAASSTASRRRSNASSAPKSLEPPEGRSPISIALLNNEIRRRSPRPARERRIARRTHPFLIPEPITELVDHIGRELDDLKDLRDNSNELVNRTVQLVNIRLEDHGQAILVFTVVTVVFLPLSFVASFFGMNVKDIRHTDYSQKLFWLVALLLTVFVLGGSLVLAFFGNNMMEKFILWKDNRRQPKRQQKKTGDTLYKTVGREGFRVLDVNPIGSSF